MSFVAIRRRRALGHPTAAIAIAPPSPSLPEDERPALDALDHAEAKAVQRLHANTSVDAAEVGRRVTE
jgi:hypothetical protein